MVEHTRAERLCHVTLNPAHPLVREHTEGGSRAVALAEGMGGRMIALDDKAGTRRSSGRVPFPARSMGARGTTGVELEQLHSLRRPSGPATVRTMESPRTAFEVATGPGGEA